jgi:MFS family permease
LSLFAVTVHIVPHAIDLGIPAINAANLLATYGGMGIVGNLALGSLGDRIGNRQVYIIGFILMLVSLFWLILANETWMLFLFAAVFGFAQGGMAPQGSPLLARLFGLGSHGLLLGVVGLGFRIGAGIGPFMTGYIFDLTDSYQVAFLVCSGIVVVGLIFASSLKPTERLGGGI